MRRREAKLPYGYVMRELRVVPAIALTSPDDGGGADSAQSSALRSSVDLLNNRDTGSKGEVLAAASAGLEVSRRSTPFAFARAGERATYRFTVAIPSIADRELRD